jgi:hypothetical protein
MFAQVYLVQTEVVMNKKPKNRDIEIAEKALESAVARLREARRDVSAAIAALVEIRRTVRIVKRRRSSDRGKGSTSGEHGA